MGYQTGEMLKRIENVLISEKNKDKIIKMAKEFEHLLKTYKERFGRGNASERIIGIMEEL